MPISNITQNISAIPQAGHRGIDVQTIFVNKQEAFQDALTGVFVGQINTLRTQLNTFVSETNIVATQVNTNATNASTSATIANTQAGIATTKAGEANTSASQALNYRNQAETFANQASASASSVDASNIVHRIGNEDVDGIKNFIKSPIVPTPTTGTQAVNKDYVDSSITPEYNPTPTIGTGTATFNSITNNINLTGIGIGVEIGDVIQISGADDAKNNSEFTVEVITDANNIVVNQAHAGKGTSKNIANKTGDTGVTIKLLSKWYNASDALGRDWVDVTSSRATNTTYPKPINRSLRIAIEVRQPSSSMFSIRVLNGSTKVHFTSINTTSNTPYFTAYANITGTTYTVDSLTGGNTITSWVELR